MTEPGGYAPGATARTAPRLLLTGNLTTWTARSARPACGALPAVAPFLRDGRNGTAPLIPLLADEDRQGRAWPGGGARTACSISFLIRGAAGLVRPPPATEAPRVVTGAYGESGRSAGPWRLLHHNPAHPWDGWAELAARGPACSRAEPGPPAFFRARRRARPWAFLTSWRLAPGRRPAARAPAAHHRRRVASQVGLRAARFALSAAFKRRPRAVQAPAAQHRAGAPSGTDAPGGPVVGPRAGRPDSPGGVRGCRPFRSARYKPPEISTPPSPFGVTPGPNLSPGLSLGLEHCFPCSPC